MSTLKQRFEELQLEKPEVTQADLTRATGATAPSVSAWFSGKTKSMKLGTAIHAAQLYGVRAMWLAEGELPKYHQPAAEEAPAGERRPSQSEIFTRHVNSFAAILNAVPTRNQEQAAAAAIQALLNYLPPPPTGVPPLLGR